MAIVGPGVKVYHEAASTSEVEKVRIALASKMGKNWANIQKS